MFRKLDRKGIAVLFAVLSFSIMLVPMSLTASAAPTGSNFDHIVIIAMENQHYGSVIGSSSAPFINHLASTGSTISNYHSYGQNIGGCSAGCYQAYTEGFQTVSDSWCPRASSPCQSSSTPNIATQLQSAGLTSTAFCEDSCPRGADHFPWIGYSSTWNSCVTGSFSCAGSTTSSGMVLYGSTSSNSGSFGNVTSNAGNAAFINYLNSANPANYIWFTPTDNHNMHDNSVSTGDNYIASLLVGTGTISNPSSGTVFSTSLFKQSSTFLYLWWDEYDPSPNVEYGSMIKVGYTSTGGYTEYNSLHTIEANWGLTYLTKAVSGDSSMSDVFGSSPPGTTTSTSSGPVSTFTFLYIGLIAGAGISVIAYLAKYHSRNRKLARMVKDAQTEPLGPKFQAPDELSSFRQGAPKISQSLLVTRRAVSSQDRAGED